MCVCECMYVCMYNYACMCSCVLCVKRLYVYMVDNVCMYCVCVRAFMCACAG